MKISILLILCGYIGFVSSLEAVSFGGLCESDEECKSQHCISVCESEEKMCIEPKWYFLRHEKVIPPCRKEKYRNRKINTLAFVKPRRIGHSCHSDINCNADHCVPMCDPERTMWRCIEPRSFYTNNKLPLPECSDQTYVYPKMVEDNAVDVVEDEGEPILPSKSLGKKCSAQSECFSQHCATVCQSDEKRCIEPEISYTSHGLSVPTCISAKVIDDLVKEINKLTNAPNIEEVGERKFRFNKI